MLRVIGLGIKGSHMFSSPICGYKLGLLSKLHRLILPAAMMSVQHPRNQNNDVNPYPPSVLTHLRQSLTVYTAVDASAGCLKTLAISVRLGQKCSKMVSICASTDSTDMTGPRWHFTLISCHSASWACWLNDIGGYQKRAFWLVVQSKKSVHEDTKQHENSSHLGRLVFCFWFSDTGTLSEWLLHLQVQTQGFWEHKRKTFWVHVNMKCQQKEDLDIITKRLMQGTVGAKTALNLS